MTSGNENKENKVNKSSASAIAIRIYNVADHYQILDKVGRGAYGTVFKAKGLKDGRSYAIKKLENNDTKLQQQGFPITALREISLLKQIDHPNIIKLKQIIVSKPSKRNLFRGSTFLVFQYMEHDFAGLFKMKVKYSLPQIKCFLKQLIEGVAYLHRNKILHRDIKSANILLNDEGNVKLGDFGLGRKVRFEHYFTYKVVTLWYRAPQLLLGCKTYTDKIDVWSIGCVAAEFFTGQVLFRKQTQYAQMQKIYEIIGDFDANGMTVNDQFQKTYSNFQDLRPKKAYPKELTNYLKRHSPNISETAIDFIERLLHLDQNKRLSCEEALRHPFFSQKPVACNRTDIQKMKYEYHQMFRDRSIQIVRAIKGENGNEKNHRPKQTRIQKEVRAPRDHYDNRRENKVQWESKHHDPYYSQKKRDDHRSYQNRRYEREHSSVLSSRSDQSNSYSSSSRSSYSSNSISERRRSRQYDHRRRPSRDRDDRYRDHYYRREQRKRNDRRADDKYYDKKDDRYVKYHDDKKYRDSRDERKKYDEYEKRKEYREQYPRKDEKRYEYTRRDYGKNDRRDDRKQDRIDKKEQRRDERRDHSGRRQEKRYENRQMKYQKYEKSTFESKDRKYYDDRDYRRKQEKLDDKHSKEKYQDNQRHEYVRRDEPYERKTTEKSFYMNKGGQRRNDYHSKSSDRSQNNHYKKEKEYNNRHKPYHYQHNQRKPYYKKQYQGNDRNH